MKTLYELLSVEPNAVHLDIERGYRRCLDAYLANKGTGQPDQETLQMRAIREAYLLLSSPTRRQAYDHKLRESAALRYARAGTGGSPRASVMLVIALLLGSGSYLFEVEQAKVHVTLHVEAAAAGTPDQPDARALADETARVEKQKREGRAAAIRRREMGQARSDAQRWNLQNQQLAGVN